MSALLDTAQIASKYGLDRSYVTDKLTKRADFPSPRVDVSRRLRRWDEHEVAQFMAGRQSKRAAMSSADSL